MILCGQKLEIQAGARFLVLYSCYVWVHGMPFWPYSENNMISKTFGQE